MAAEQSPQRITAEQAAQEPLAVALYAHVETLSQQAQTTMRNMRGEVQDVAAKQEELAAALERLTMRFDSQQQQQQQRLPPNTQQEEQQGSPPAAQGASQQDAQVPPWMPDDLRQFWLNLTEERQVQTATVPAPIPLWVTNPLQWQLEEDADTPNLSPVGSMADLHTEVDSHKSKDAAEPIQTLEQMAASLRQAGWSVQEPAPAESPEPQEPPGYELTFLPRPPPPPFRPRGSGPAGRGSMQAGRGQVGQAGRGQGGQGSGQAGQGGESSGTSGRHGRGKRGKGGRGRHQTMASTSTRAESWGSSSRA